MVVVLLLVRTRHFVVVVAHPLKERVMLLQLDLDDDEDAVAAE